MPGETPFSWDLERSAASASAGASRYQFGARSTSFPGPNMSATQSLLLEIGVEELPSSFVDAALSALPALVESRLGELRLTHGPVKALGTPRRLAIIVRGLAEAQLDLDEEGVGPPETAAYKDGKPTKAAEAYAA